MIKRNRKIWLTKSPTNANSGNVKNIHKISSMKKIVFVLFYFAIISCNSDNDSSYNIQNDLILGRWQYVTAYIDDYEEVAKNCSDILVFDTLQIRKDYSFIGNNLDKCIPNDTIQFHWERINQNTYRFQKKGETSNVITKVIFQNSNNSLLIKVSVDTTLVYNRIK